MTALVAPDAVEAAARAMYESDLGAPPPGVVYLPWQAMEGEDRDEYLNLATVALAAAAPLIAQQAHGVKTVQVWGEGAWADTYVAFPVLDDASSVQATTRRLTARAATLTPKEN